MSNRPEVINVKVAAKALANAEAKYGTAKLTLLVRGVVAVKAEGGDMAALQTVKAAMSEHLSEATLKQMVAALRYAYVKTASVIDMAASIEDREKAVADKLTEMVKAANGSPTSFDDTYRVLRGKETVKVSGAGKPITVGKAEPDQKPADGTNSNPKPAANPITPNEAAMWVIAHIADFEDVTLAHLQAAIVTEIEKRKAALTKAA